MGDLSNEVVAIIGGSSGIGKETAMLFASQGAQVILIARGAERLQKAAADIQSLGGKVETMQVDVSSPIEVKKAAVMITDKFGRIDAAIYSAATFYLSPVETMDLSLARQSMEINYWGALHITQAFLPLIRKGKRRSIIFISSLSAQCTPPFFTAYASTKHALRGFVLSVRQELKSEGIHVGMVTPGPVDTPLIEKDIHQDMYRLPLGIPVLKPETVALGVFRAVMRRKKDLIIPRRMAFAARLTSAFPILVETYYRLTIPGWNKLVQSQRKRHMM
jgi:short-subunit dehydrogenase